MALKYLNEHVDEILDAIRHSKDLLCKDGAWETTAWARSMPDAIWLAEAVRDAVFAEVDQVDGCVHACVGVVRLTARFGAPVRWGVLVKLAARR
jgi:hypothetical protein